MRCPSCKSPNAKGNGYCTVCGAALRLGPGDDPPGGGPRASQPERRDAAEILGTGRPEIGNAFRDWFETSKDLVHGQIVIVTARWLLVVSGLLLAFWNPDALGELRIQVVLILSLAAANFFLHSQLLMRKPVVAPLAYAASAADMLVISAIIIAAGGFSSGLYVFYFPALLAVSVAFRTEVSLVLAGGAMALYGLIGLPDTAGDGGAVLFTRLTMMAGIAFCGNVYWRTERDRRRATEEDYVPVEPEVAEESVIR